MKVQNYVITGMTCANCVTSVTKAIKKSRFVEEAIVNLATEKAKVLLSDDGTDDEIIKLVKDAGYNAIINDKAHQKVILDTQKHYEQQQKLMLLISFLLTLPVLLPMIERFFGGQFFSFFYNPWVQFIFATPVQFVVGARFYKGAYHSLRGKSANMDVLVALGTTVAYSSSLVLGVILGHHQAINFESSMVIITLVLLGKVLEYSARERTTNAITKLMAGRATTVRLMDRRELPIEEVKKGMRIQSFAGEKIALDAVIVRGTASFDESYLTGESLPVVKTVGDSIFEGAINLDSEIEATVTHEEDESTIAKMVEMMSEAQSTKPNIQKFADKISNIFVPVILLIALLAFIMTAIFTNDFLTAMMHSVAVLVIACPCALGLATPTAIISGTGLAAKHGLLIKNANALELSHTVKTVFFDKTGTLTTGEFLLEKFDGTDFDYQILASLESHSAHPLAKSITLSAYRSFSKSKITQLIDVRNFTEIVGQGVSALINDKEYYAGNAKLMAEINVSVPETTNTVIYLAIKKRLLAVATLSSEIKSDAFATIQALKNRGLKTIMLTGDNEISAKKIQYEVQVDKIYSELTPEEKLKIIQETPGTMMIGDGINDSIALAGSTVGVAVATASDIAMEAGDVIVTSGKLRRVVDLFDISRLTVLKIRQNYFWAFIYNVLGIPLAAFGFLNPMIAAAAMSLSSLSVVFNSLLLVRKKLR